MKCYTNYFNEFKCLKENLLFFDIHTHVDILSEIFVFLDGDIAEFIISNNDLTKNHYQQLAAFKEKCLFIISETIFNLFNNDELSIESELSYQKIFPFTKLFSSNLGSMSSTSNSGSSSSNKSLLTQIDQITDVTLKLYMKKQIVTLLESLLDQLLSSILRISLSNICSSFCRLSKGCKLFLVFYSSLHYDELIQKSMLGHLNIIDKFILYFTKQTKNLQNEIENVLGGDISTESILNQIQTLSQLPNFIDNLAFFYNDQLFFYESNNESSILKAKELYSHSSDCNSFLSTIENYIITKIETEFILILSSFSELVPMYTDLTKTKNVSYTSKLGSYVKPFNNSLSKRTSKPKKVLEKIKKFLRFLELVLVSHSFDFALQMPRLKNSFSVLISDVKKLLDENMELSEHKATINLFTDHLSLINMLLLEE